LSGLLIIIISIIYKRKSEVGSGTGNQKKNYSDFSTLILLLIQEKDVAITAFNVGF